LWWVAGSAISDQRYDAALYWGGQGYGFKAAGAAAFADPNRDNTDFQYDGSFSLRLSLIPTRTTPTFNTTAPFHYCMRTPA